MSACETESTPALFAFYCPADDLVLRFTRRSSENNRLQPLIVFAKPNAIIKFFLQLEGMNSPANRVLGRSDRDRPGPSLDGRVPFVRSGPGFVVKIAPNPFGDLVMKTARVKSCPMELDEPATPLHLFLDHL